jgi:phage repressor protein C with HTH and peptisase S24 domain
MYTHHVQAVNMISVYTICDNALMESMGQRLRKARIYAKFSSARQAAIYHGWTISTYLAHENGQNDFNEETAQKYSQAFRVSASWLLLDEGTMERRNVVGIKGLVSAGGSIDTGVEQPPGDGDLYEIEVPFPLSRGAIAFEVSGESMYPRYDPGDVIVCDRPVESPEQLLGAEAAVATIGGARFLKRIFRGARRGHYDLESFNAPIIRAARLQWASAIRYVVRAGNWQRINKKSR